MAQAVAKQDGPGFRLHGAGIPFARSWDSVCTELGQRSLEAVYFAGRRDPGLKRAFTPVLVAFVQKTPARNLFCRAYGNEGFAASIMGGWRTVPPSLYLLGQASRLADG